MDGSARGTFYPVMTVLNGLEGGGRVELLLVTNGG